MRTINKAPLLRQGDHGPAVEDVQSLLNLSNIGRKAPIWSKTAILDEDGKFGALTKAKVVEYQRAFGLQVDGTVGPETRGSLFAPQADRVDQAQGIASNWTLLAKGAVATLRAWVEALQFGFPPPRGNLATAVEALRIHFHIDLPNPPGAGPSRNGSSANPLDLIAADDRLRFIQQIYDDVGFILGAASIREGRVFTSIGLRESQLVGIDGKSAGTGPLPTSKGEILLICFPPSFHGGLTADGAFRTTHHQAATVLHECCHYVMSEHNRDYAYGLPYPAGVPGRRSVHNYQQLTADEAIDNPDSYNLFAEHVTFGRDTRFGRFSDDLRSFECGSQSFCR